MLCNYATVFLEIGQNADVEWIYFQVDFVAGS